MTPDEIKSMHPSDISTNSWLKEVALQLAIMNEKPATRPYVKKADKGVGGDNSD